MKSTLQKILIVSILGVSSLYSWEVNTHQALTRCATTNECKNDGSFRAENLQNFVKKDALLLKKDYRLQKYEEFPNYTYRGYAISGEKAFYMNWKINFIHKGNYIDMIEAGSILEDALYPDADLTGADGRFNNHFYDPQQGGKKLGFGWGDRTDAVTWAITGADLKDNSNSYDRKNNYAYKNALDYYRNSFIAITKEDREKNQAKMFVSLGHLLHLLQDMHVPAHVRDDSHSEYDRLEYWARRENGFRLNRGEFKDINQTILSAVKNYDTLSSIKINKASNALSQYPLSSSFYILEATFTSNNFVSAGRDKGIDFDTIFDSNHNHPNNTNDTIKKEVIKKTALGYITYAKYYYSSNGNTVSNIISGNINPTVIAMEIEKSWNNGVYVLETDNDRTPIIDNALNVIPRAVGASEAFINYFFRGRIEAKIVDGKLVVKNISNPDLAQSPDNVVFKKGGHFIVKYDAKDGTRKILVFSDDGKELDRDLDVNETFILDDNFMQTLGRTPDIGDEENIIVLYDGKIGDERGLAVSYASKKLTNIDLLLSFDKSGSMGSDIENAKNSAITVLDNNFNDNNSSFVEIEAFNDNVSILLSYDSNITKAKDSINTLYSGGGTALYDAIKKAGERAKQHKIDTNASKSIVILYTDGEENGDSSATREEAINAISKANNPEIDEVFLIQVGNNSYGKQDLEGIARDAGNRRFLNVNNASELKNSIDSILKEQ